MTARPESMYRPEDLKRSMVRSLRDPALREAVERATATTMAKRARRLAARPDWEALRAEAARIRQQVLDRLDHYLEQFEATATRAGFHVHWARDAREACDTVLGVARANHATRIVKSKSMVTEEIGLNAHLEAAGLQVVETDLGEFIIQLAGEPPSHLTAPALHKRREDIGRLFQDRLGIAYTDDPAELTEAARRALRDRFLEADMGITGANFGLARDGALTVIENEGNALLTMNLPRIHVAVMGLERLLPSSDELPVFLDLLPASATGQAATSYVSLVRGPAGPGRAGPEEVHVVLVDNGRSRVLADPDHRDLLRCIRCGACQSACPVYQQVGGHPYGWVVQGPIGAALIPLMVGLDRGRHAPFASSLCGVCAEVCPVRIDLPRHLLELRHRIAAAGSTGAAERAVVRSWAWAARHPRVYRTITAISRVLGFVPAPAWKRSRDLPRPARRSFAALWKKERSRP